MSRLAKCLSILGTGSDVGKSIVVTALCRIARNRGIDVAPYKAQNMSNNSYVTLDGGEMGRAQIVQAQAACVEPHVDMNPILLKPGSNTSSQVIVHGKPTGSYEASEYFADTTQLFQKSFESLNRLRAAHDLIIIEGAGSCCEVNLRATDFVNFRTAHKADADVILIGDIDRGGIFAQIIGTLEVIPPEDRQRIKGIIINKFRGDASLFDDGIKWIEQRTGLPVYGMVPWYYHIEIEAEDAMPLTTAIDPVESASTDSIRIGVIRFPHISNFTDFDMLSREPAVDLHYLSKPRSLANYDLLILPGSKHVRFDLEWFRNTGWEEELNTYHNNGGHVVGICGGYQMLGKVFNDPKGIEGEKGSSKGLGYLDIETTMNSEKILTQTQGTWNANNLEVQGYEIHMGKTILGTDSKPLIRIHSRNRKNCDDLDGAIDSNGQVWGCYLHGLFDAVEFRNFFLQQLAPKKFQATQDSKLKSITKYRDEQYDLLAKHFEKYLNLEFL